MRGVRVTGSTQEILVAKTRFPLLEPFATRVAKRIVLGTDKHVGICGLCLIPRSACTSSFAGSMVLLFRIVAPRLGAFRASRKEGQT